MSSSAGSTEAIIWKDYVEEGLPPPDYFQVQPVDLPQEIQDGQALVELLYITVDPYLRGRMKNVPGYFSAAFQPGKPMSGLRGVATVKQSKASQLKEGAIVFSSGLTWQQLQVVPADQLTPVDEQLLRDKQLPASVYLGALGMTGMTAYASLARIGKPEAGNTVFVSGAAGAVGLIVGQLCKNVYGCARVVGSAGSDEKVAKLKEYGYDAAFNYKTTDTAKALKELCPEGIDVYFDNVGGPTLEAALNSCNTHARIVACGSVSQYNAKPEDQYGVKNLFNIVTKRITMQGFIVGDWLDLRAQFLSDMTRYLHEGKVVNVETVVQGGLKAVGQAFNDMMSGKNFGKMVVQVGPDPFRK